LENYTQDEFNIYNQSFKKEEWYSIFIYNIFCMISRVQKVIKIVIPGINIIKFHGLSGYGW
jgi:hypothetical protein